MIQPSASEQYMLELINRARLNPQGEATLFGLGDLNTGLPLDTISINSKQPLAFNESLITAGRSHSQWMLDNDIFSHTGVNNSNSKDRMSNAGYQFTGSWFTGENIGYKSTSGVLNLESYTADIHKNLFLSSGHRKNILKADYREIGIGNLTGDFNGFNALMVTQDFAKSGSNVFLTGVAYNDLTLKDKFYTIGEGLGGIQITAVRQSDQASYNITSMDAGGYQMALPTGTYNVSFMGNGLTLGSSQQITIGSENIKLDLNTDNIPNLFYGGIGNDTLVGSLSRDTLVGDAGDDSLSGGEEIDLLIGGTGNDTINGGAGNDKLYGKTGNDSMMGGLGNDYLSGLDGLDTIYGDAGNDKLDGGNSNDTLYGGTENDTLIGGYGRDNLNGDAGDDSLEGGVDLDLLNGGDGNDTLNGGDGDDKLYGKIGNDLMMGGLGNDYFSGLDGLDTIYGDTGNDKLDGGNGNDVLYGGVGNDSLIGGYGNDKLDGGEGDDTAIGGAGSDIFVLKSGQSTMIINDFVDGIDFLGFTGNLDFNDLNIINDPTGTTAIIYDLSNSNAVLASVMNVNAATLSQADFVAV